MIVGKTKSDIDKLWNAFWTGGITNPVSVIEQINYLLFIRRLDDIETLSERLAARTGNVNAKRIFSGKNQHLRWSNFKHLKPDAMFTVVQEEVFPFIKNLGNENESIVTSFSKNLSDAVFLIPKSSLLASAVDLISGLDLDNADTAGDLYEYLLSKLSTSGINGQFRTPRHIIRMMVKMIDPKVEDRICDPACGTGGFLFSSLEHILEHNTSPALVQEDDEGQRHGFIGDQLSKEERRKFETDTFYGFDFDQTMLRVASMNLWLHGINLPSIKYADTLSKNFTEENRYDVILANPPFKGTLDYSDCSPSLQSEIRTKKTELLFLFLALRMLDVGGRAAIIVPDGVLFGKSAAHVQVRKHLVEEHQLEGVVSMPSGVFRPYATVSTAILLFTKGGKTDKVWFYEMKHDGFSLDDKRLPIKENDLPDIIDCWISRHDGTFGSLRESMINKVQTKLIPLREKQRNCAQRVDELQFESSIEQTSDQKDLQLANAALELKEATEMIQETQHEYNRLSQQFWVDKQTIVDKNYDLSANRYRHIERDQRSYWPKIETVLNRIAKVQPIISEIISELTTDSKALNFEILQRSEWLPLSKLVKINPPATKGLNRDQECSFIPMEAVNEDLGQIRTYDTRKVGQVLKGYTSFIEGDVLFAKITPCMENGKATIARGLKGGIGFGTTEFHVLRPNSDVLSEWILFLIRQQWFRDMAERSMRGSAGQKRVPAEFFHEVLVPKPVLDGQKEVIEILSHMEQARKFFEESKNQTTVFNEALYAQLFSSNIDSDRSMCTSLAGNSKD